MTGTFVARMDELRKLVGGGKLQGKVIVDQIYAQNQHENLSFKHTGGGAKFLTIALVQNRNNIMRNLSRACLHGKMEEAMAKGMENVVKGVQARAPHEFNDLRNSGHPIVKSAGRIVYDRPPVVKRLTKNQLKAKDRARGDRS